MLIEWRPIRSFPGYSVADTGLVMNVETGLILREQVNQRGVVNVGLTRNLVQYKRSVPLLVLDAFKTRPSEAYDCSINLDGDKRNNHVHNLEWRPKWFAISYNDQFDKLRVASNRNVVDIDTGNVYEHTWHAAVTHGLMHKDVVISATTGARVWPTGQCFAFTDA